MGETRNAQASAPSTKYGKSEAKKLDPKVLFAYLVLYFTEGETEARVGHQVGEG